MPDEVDDLILQMQHLVAEARASTAARSHSDRATKLKTQAQTLAAQAQEELDSAQKAQADGEAMLARARTPGLAPLEAADLLVAGRTQSQDAKTRAIKARARLDFALSRMDEAERLEWNAMQAQAAAETHAQLAESGDDSSRAPTLPLATREAADSGAISGATAGGGTSAGSSR
jgi:hypothetical protein